VNIPTWGVANSDYEPNLAESLSQGARKGKGPQTRSQTEDIRAKKERGIQVGDYSRHYQLPSEGLQTKKASSGIRQYRKEKKGKRRKETNCWIGGWGGVVGLRKRGVEKS